MTGSTLCLRCWRQLGVADALYECPACDAHADGRPAWLGTQPSGSRRVKDLPRSRWRTLLGGRDERPRCTLHADADLRLLCRCGHPLASGLALGRGRPMALGFAGPPGAGKTLLTITMVRALRGLALGDRSIGVLGVDGTEERFRALAEAFLDHGLQPHASLPEQADGQTEAFDASGNFCWELIIERGRRPTGTAFLATFDLAGETWALPPAQAAPRFDRYLGLTGSVVFLVDGASLAADLELGVHDAWSDSAGRGDGGTAELTVLRNLIERIGPRRRQVDVALVLSKADLLWDHPDWRGLRPAEGADGTGAVADVVESLLAQSQRRDLLLAARRHFRGVELFAVSSLGFRPGRDDVAGGSLTTRVTPAGVLDPILWLLTKRLPGLRAS